MSKATPRSSNPDFDSLVPNIPFMRAAIRKVGGETIELPSKMNLQKAVNRR